MPPKSKRHSKTPSKLSSSSDQSEISPQTPPSSSLTSVPEPEVSENELSRALEEASIKYPSLISKSAFIGRITDAETSGHTATIWLSESAMVACSIFPGSIVSVSLAASRKNFLSGFPLDSLMDKCADHIGVDISSKKGDDIGKYFVLAVVLPSCKVLKNGVRLSWSLSCTLGWPAIGTIAFVSPIQVQSLDALSKGTNKLLESTNTTVSHLSLYNCKDLYLELISSMNRLTMEHDKPYNYPSEMNHNQLENGNISSPKTPLLHQQKLNSPVSSRLLSERCQESVPSLNNSKGKAFTSYDITVSLDDKMTRELWQSCAVRWLRTRNLLPGNLVTIPIHGEMFIFRVEGTNDLLEECPDHNLSDEGKHDLFRQTSTSVVDVNVAFVDCNTKVHLRSSLTSAVETREKISFPQQIFEGNKFKVNMTINLPKLGGLSKECAILKEIILSSSVKDILSSLGLRTTKGVLLHGPPGTGKTSLAHACACDAGVNLFSVNGPEIVSQYYGESEKALHEVFDSASQAAPAVVFIDELDAIAPARKEGGEELSQRIVATLLNLMDGISRTDGILVIAATNRPDSIDPALRRPGRLDREIEIGVPSPKQRLDILRTILNEMEHSLVDMQIQHLASTTHGFVGADLAALCNEAALICLRRYVKFKKSCDSSAVSENDVQCKETGLLFGDCSDAKVLGSDPSGAMQTQISTNIVDCSSSLSDMTVFSEINQSSDFRSTVQKCTDVQEESLLKVDFTDFEKAKMKVRPSAMREVILEVPKVRWDDVGGQNEVKKQLMEAVEWPQKYQDAFKRIGTRPPTGVLMFGPPGCSKTLMARAVASEAGLNFLAVKGPELFSKWVGESEKAVRSLFAKARANAPSIIFFDEIDSLAIIRGQESDRVSVADRVMSQLLVELDGLHERVDVTVIAATNRPDKIDPALLRPGRFDRLLYVGPPNEIDREDIFRIHMRRMPCSSDISMRELAHLTDGCTGADISLICREAAIAAIDENLDASEISMEHFKTGIARVQPSEVQSYQEFSLKFQRLVHSKLLADDIGHQHKSSISKWTVLRSKLKSLMLLPFQLPAVLASSKA
ncbi:PREDICTED: calmodulin-interacting protein 111 isoform X2 [Nelumbo nucifera]|uniref:Calmodulin-interacting protein 111 isoform X2 n=1 Tax=Nelumbo nucifera TaxID=4432 RepID=A0A1U8B7J3_NELNU|nr:PREDICTED: calmodulin-interacting protein 111 isoform X2 [Nelumbo nucifera]